MNENYSNYMIEKIRGGKKAMVDLPGSLADGRGLIYFDLTVQNQTSFSWNICEVRGCIQTKLHICKCNMMMISDKGNL